MENDSIILNDATILIRRLCRQLPEENNVRIAALDWLKRKGFVGQILRQSDDLMPVDPEITGG